VEYRYLQLGIDMAPYFFGARADGSPVTAIELRNKNGLMVRLISLGATVQALQMPARDGTCADLVLGHATVAEYEAKRQYLGVTVGRYANRIAKGNFPLEGKRFQLDINDGANHLHGGYHGFDLANWKVETFEPSVSRVVLSHASPDGEGGYPGQMLATAAFSLGNDDTLAIDYRAEADQPTIANVTHHGYFNLGGEGSGSNVLGHTLQLSAATFTPVDSASIPTGEVRHVAGSAFDFRTAKNIGDGLRRSIDGQLLFARGYDHNFSIDGPPGALRTAAVVTDPQSGRSMELLTTAPGLQFYSGNFLDGATVGKTGMPYRRHWGLCLEPQYFPDSPNKPGFPSAVLLPGQVFSNRIVLKFSTG
jgi:aldose 1-epimerase